MPGTNRIGRELDNDIVLENEARGLSRHHAEIQVMADRILLQDLNSRNGTFVNHKKVTQQELLDGDLLHLGKVAFKFVQAPASSLQDAVSSDISSLSIVRRLSSVGQTQIDFEELLHPEPTRYAGSILKLRQQDTQQRSADKLRILLEVSKQLSIPQTLDALLNKILDLLFTIMDVDRAAILLRHEQTQQLELKALKARLGMTVDQEFYSSRIVNFVCENGDAILIADARDDERFSDSPSILHQAIHASIGVPLKPKDQVIGVLYADNLSLSNAYSQEDLEFLAGLASQAAVAIENAHLYQKMQAEAEMRAKLERFFPKAVSQKIREEGELKIVETEVTALFSDITGFTEMSSQMEPRQVLGMLNEYFKIMVEDIVFRYEGTLEKYIADALLAVWGSPYSRLDDAQLAMQAAIEMQWAMRRLNQRWAQEGRDREVQIHIGLNTGRVAAGNIGSELIQYTNIGDAMNVASRICSTATAGQILIAQTTLDRLGDRCPPVNPMSLVTVKGKAEPLQLYQVLWEEVPSAQVEMV
ncbi:adenylate cyclase [Leptolyngbya sp. 'hensonii']|nr:adenylate cyclase [Leptolyngbya sp. 'hensonii']